MRRAGCLVVLLLLVLILVFVPSLWLRPIGAALIHDDGPAKADIAVVLAGDQWGLRILKAAELVRGGYVPAALVSGPPFYDMHESDAAIEFAVRRGNPREWFIPLPNSALSTRDESRDVLQELRKRGVQTVLLVTSDYHTARAGRIYRATEQQMGGGPSLRLVAAPDRYFAPGNWWQSREGMKIAFMEWSKTVATALGK